MRTEQSTNCFVPLQKFTARSVVLLWFSVACFGVRVSVCVHIILSVLFAGWPHFGKELTICSLCILTIYNFS